MESSETLHTFWEKFVSIVRHRFCDRIAVFSQGRIMEYGTHDELAHIDGGIYAGMYAAQAQYYQ